MPLPVSRCVWLLAGQAVPVSTGSPIPVGLDCVVKAEDTRREGGVIVLTAPLSPWQNYIFQGEDMRAGAALFPAGTRLDWTCMGALAAQGVGDALRLCPTPGGRALHRRGTGMPPGAALPPGGIYDANGPLLAARLAVLGMEPIPLPP